MTIIVVTKATQKFEKKTRHACAGYAECPYYGDRLWKGKWYCQIHYDELLNIKAREVHGAKNTVE